MAPSYCCYLHNNARLHNQKETEDVFRSEDKTINNKKAKRDKLK